MTTLSSTCMKEMHYMYLGTKYVLLNVENALHFRFMNELLMLPNCLFLSYQSKTPSFEAIRVVSQPYG
jgi:hypothetical protein